jgi:NAD(P)-dependent dehydrogenase (short-subunit alcohol dehydrogenase family)
MRGIFDLTGRVAVVMGATSGIGRTIAMGLACQGAHVVPSGRRAAQVDEICDALESMGRKTVRMTADVTDRASVDALRDAVVDRLGRVDILVNAAGFTKRQPSREICVDEWQKMFDTNLSGALRACQSFHDALKASGRGRVINIVSLGSFTAFHEVAAYCASKTALLSLTKSLAVEWAPEGICVNAIAPGVFLTELNQQLVNDSARGKELLLRTPMRRFGKSEELVGAAVLLASDASSFITGQCITVDGGFLASGVNS